MNSISKYLDEFLERIYCSKPIRDRPLAGYPHYSGKSAFLFA